MLSQQTLSSYEPNEADNSGLKLAVDFSFLKQLEGRNLDSAVYNKTLVNETGIDIKKDGIFGYDIHVANIKLDTLRFPSEVNVDPHVVDGINTVTITLKNLVVSLLADYKIKVIGLSDQGTASPVNITLSELKAEFNFDSTGQINFKQFAFTLGTLDIKLNSYIYRAVFWVLKSFVKSAINGQAETLRTALIAQVNDFITKPTLIDVGFGIGFNLTNIDRPKLDFFTIPGLLLPVIKPTFLAKPKTTVQTTSTLSFGVHASMYPNMDPSIKPDILPAPKMKFNSGDEDNDFSVLLSDYTVNTILFMVQQSSFLRYTIKNDTSNPLPMAIDTQGLSQLIPELGPAFNQTFPCELNFIIDPVDNAQPLLSSNMMGSKIRLNATLEFNVIVDPDPFVDPVKAVVLTFDAEILAQLVTIDGKLTVQIPSTEIKTLTVVSEIGDIQKDRIQRSLDSLFFIATKQIADKMTNIDISTMIFDALGLKAPVFDIDYNNGYIEASINLVKP